MSDRPSLLERVLSGSFGLLLRLLPPPFRRRFGDDMRAALTLTLREAHGSIDTLAAFGRAVVDLLANLVPEWTDWIRRESIPVGGPGSAGPDSVRATWVHAGSMRQDLRYAIRTLRKRPLFTLTAVATLGLSIGAATTMFSVVNGVLLRPLPYRDPGSLVEVWQVFPSWKEREGLSQIWQNLGVSYPQYEDWKRDQTAFESVAVFYTGEWSQMTSTGDGPARKLSVGVASASLLRTLGVEPILGRGFLPEEEGPAGEGSARSALISEAFWKGSFGGDPEVLGRHLNLDGDDFTIVGVLPSNLRLRSMNHHGAPDNGGSQELWLLPGAGPLGVASGSNIYDAIARIRPGVTLGQAAADVQNSMFQGAPESRRYARLVPRAEEELRGLQEPLLLLLGATAVLLLIGCTNTATLFLSELGGRAQEISTRWALGAGQIRVVRQLLTESCLLGGLGSLAGMGLAWAGTQAMVAMAPPVPRLHEVSLDPRVLAFAAGLGFLTGVLFGIVPAVSSLRHGSAALSNRAVRKGSRATERLQTGLLSVQISLTVVLLVTGALLARSLFTLRSVDPGFDAEGLSTVRISIPDHLVRTAEREADTSDEAAERLHLTRARARITADLLEELGALPGVIGVAAADALPFPADRVPSNTIQILDGSDDGIQADPDAMRVWPGYFETMGIPLLSGRTLSETDQTVPPQVAVISESMATRFWPDGSPLGRVIRLFGRDPLTIVGVVGDVNVGSLRRPPQPTFYLPLGSLNTADLNLVVRATENTGPLAGQMRRTVQESYRTIPVSEEGELPALVAWSAREEAYRALLMGVFAAMATLLAAVGIFGVTARGVTQRARELGIRIAIGAEGGTLVAEVLKKALKLSVPAVLLGLVASFWATQVLSTFLFRVSATDPATFGAVGAFAAGLCLAASYVPARRITRIDPAAVLKDE